MQSTKIEAFDLADELKEDIEAIATNSEAIQTNAADIDTLEAEMENVKKSVSDGKRLVAEAITNKGFATSANSSFETMATNIINIPTLDTSDANATAGDILSGKSAYVNGLKVSGNIPSKAAATITPGINAQTIAAGQYLSGDQTIAGDANLVAGNIAKGKSIFGVNGTYDPVPSYSSIEMLDAGDGDEITFSKTPQIIFLQYHKYSKSISDSNINTIYLIPNTSNIKYFVVQGSIKNGSGTAMSSSGTLNYDAYYYLYTADGTEFVKIYWWKSSNYISVDGTQPTVRAHILY